MTRNPKIYHYLSVSGVYQHWHLAFVVFSPIINIWAGVWTDILSISSAPFLISSFPLALVMLQYWCCVLTFCQGKCRVFWVDWSVAYGEASWENVWIRLTYRTEWACMRACVSERKDLPPLPSIPSSSCKVQTEEAAEATGGHTHTLQQLCQCCRETITQERASASAFFPAIISREAVKIVQFDFECWDVFSRLRQRGSLFLCLRRNEEAENILLVHCRGVKHLKK